MSKKYRIWEKQNENTSRVIEADSVSWKRKTDGLELKFKKDKVTEKISGVVCLLEETENE